jgi:hypothetical protein
MTEEEKHDQESDGDRWARLLALRVDLNNPPPDRWASIQFVCTHASGEQVVWKDEYDRPAAQLLKKEMARRPKMLRGAKVEAYIQYHKDAGPYLEEKLSSKNLQKILNTL